VEFGQKKMAKLSKALKTDASLTQPWMRKGANWSRSTQEPVHSSTSWFGRGAEQVERRLGLSGWGPRAAAAAKWAARDLAVPASRELHLTWAASGTALGAPGLNMRLTVSNVNCRHFCWNLYLKEKTRWLSKAANIFSVVCFGRDFLQDAREREAVELNITRIS